MTPSPTGFEVKKILDCLCVIQPMSELKHFDHITPVTSISQSGESNWLQASLMMGERVRQPVRGVWGCRRGHWRKLCRWWGHTWMRWGSKIWILGGVYLKKWNRPRGWGWEGVGELNIGINGSRRLLPVPHIAAWVLNEETVNLDWLHELLSRWGGG